MAVLGGEVEIPTLSGKAKLTIDPGTPSGRALRMRDRGIPRLNSHGRGDQIVHVNVWIPKHLSAKERELLQQLSSSQSMVPSEEEKKATSRSFFEKVKDAFS